MGDSHLSGYCDPLSNHFFSTILVSKWTQTGYGDCISMGYGVAARAHAKTLPDWLHGLEAQTSSNEGDMIHESFNEIFSNNIWRGRPFP